MPTMLYKHPGPHEIHGDKFDYIIVEDEDIEDTIESGWFLSTLEAKEDAAKPKRGRPQGSKGKKQTSESDPKTTDTEEENQTSEDAPETEGTKEA